MQKSYHDIKIEHLSTTESRVFWTKIKNTFDYSENIKCHLETGKQKLTKPIDKATIFNHTFAKISQIEENEFIEAHTNFTITSDKKRYSQKPKQITHYIEISNLLKLSKLFVR